MFFLLETVLPAILFTLSLYIISRRRYFNVSVRSSVFSFIGISLLVFTASLLFSYLYSQLILYSYRLSSAGQGVANVPYPSWDISATFLFGVNALILILVSAAFITFQLVKRLRT